MKTAIAATFPPLLATTLGADILVNPVPIGVAVAIKGIKMSDGDLVAFYVKAGVKDLFRVVDDGRTIAEAEAEGANIAPLKSLAVAAGAEVSEDYEIVTPWMALAEIPAAAARFALLLIRIDQELHQKRRRPST